MKLVLSMGDADGALIECAVKTAPTILCDHLEEGYDPWEEFVQAVQNVPAAKLRRSREDLEKECTRDSAIAVLRQQVAQLTVRASAPVYQTSPRISPTPSYSSSALGPAAPTSQTTTSLLTSPLLSTPQWHNPTQYRSSPSPRAPLSRAQIVERVSSTPQRPNTEEGR